jgi:FMN phosphatase YigB (HAD superfamily)
LLKAALFDLDGTLLPVETGEFMNEYLKEMASAVRQAVEPQRFVHSLLASTAKMVADRNPAVTNADVFWADFNVRLGDCIEELRPLIEKFYSERFSELARVASPRPQLARRVVQTALDSGLRIALATNPVFPLTAIRQRMTWEGVDDQPWEVVTCYEEMHFCKPNPEVYLEIAEKLGVQPEECLMAGNDAEEDMVAGSVGMKTYLVTDYLIGAPRDNLKVDWTGSLDGLVDWLGRGAGIK